MTDEVLDAINATCQAWPGLSTVKSYHKFNGFTPGERPTISTSCGTVKFKRYTNTMDEATIPIEILVYLRDISPERGETAVRLLADEVRYALIADETLGGLVSTTDVTEIVFETNDLEKSERLHYAVVAAESTFFAPRQRDGETPPLLEELLLSINSETVEINE